MAPDVEDIYPLSPMQQLFWIASVGQPRLAVVQLRYGLDGPVDPGRFQQAWSSTTARHDQLRAGIVAEGLEEPVQVVVRDACVPVAYWDWSGMSTEARHDSVQRFLDEDRAHGFDLADPPLLRCALLRLGESEWQFVFTFYRGLLDGWSIEVLWKEVWRAYAELASGGQTELPTARPFRDYIAWLQERAPGAAESFWRDALRGFGQSKPERGFELARTGAADDVADVRLPLSRLLTRGLEQTARDHGLTLNTLVLGAWALAIGRWIDQDDVVVGSTVSGRPHDLSGTESMVGMFINNLPVRLTIDRSETLVACLQRLQDGHVESRRFEYASTSQILGWTDLPASRHLFDTLVVFQSVSPVHALGPSSQGIRTTDLNSALATGYPVTLRCLPGRSLLLWLDYLPSACTSSTASALMDSMGVGLHAMADAPDQRVGTLLDRMASGAGKPPDVATTVSPLPDDVQTREIVESRSATEARVLEIWCRLLGVQSARTTDDFFESGGRSFLAMRLLNEIAREFGKTMPLGALLRGATPKELAKAIDNTTSARGNAPCLVPIRTEGRKPPLFLLHGIVGDVLSYGPLASHLADNQPVYGLIPPELGVGLQGVRLEELASDYIAAIKTVAPVGPYFLAGHCAGATLAFEVAQQLHKAGEPIGMLAVIDHWLSRTAIDKRTPWLAIIDAIRNLPYWVADDLLPSGRREIAGRVRSRARVSWLAMLQRLPWRGARARRQDIRDTLGMWRLPDEMVSRLENLYAAFARYEPRSYPGRVTLFRPRALPLLSHRLRHDLGWADLAGGGVDVSVVRGSHGTILTEPLVRHLALAIEKTIDGAAGPSHQTNRDRVRAQSIG